MANPRAYLYAGFFRSALDGEIDVSKHTFKAMLTKSSYKPDVDEHRYVSDVSGEISGSGYSKGGETLSNVQVDYDSNKKRIRMVADDLEWTDATFNADGLVIYDSSGSSDKNRPLVMAVMFGDTQSPSEGSFKVKWNNDGLLYIDLA